MHVKPDPVVLPPTSLHFNLHKFLHNFHNLPNVVGFLSTNSAHEIENPFNALRYFYWLDFFAGLLYEHLVQYI